MFGAIAAIKVSMCFYVFDWPPTYHCGKVSSHLICRLLQVLQPFRDLVWLFRGGPPPGPAIVIDKQDNG